MTNGAGTRIYSRAFPKRGKERSMKKLTILLFTVALAIGAAKTYRITLFQPTVIAGTELKPGDYNLDLNGEKMVIRQGKVSAEAAVKSEVNGERYGSTSVRYAVRDGKNHLVEVRLGGTNTKLVLN
jgi:hypothetical protein